jgi:hypothetical protein
MTDNTLLAQHHLERHLISWILIKPFGADKRIFGGGVTARTDFYEKLRK